VALSDRLYQCACRFDREALALAGEHAQRHDPAYRLERHSPERRSMRGWPHPRGRKTER
jgi:hypothetical protein